MIAEQANEDVARLLAGWLERTETKLREQIQKRNIGVTDELVGSIASEMRRMAEGFLEGDLVFDESGRFVDMGVGRGHALGSRGALESTRGAIGRKPKPWYSRTYYGRLNDLQGAIGYKLMERAIDAVKNVGTGL